MTATKRFHVEAKIKRKPLDLDAHLVTKVTETTATRILHALRREVQTCIGLLEPLRHDARASGQLEALRHVDTVLRTHFPLKRRRGR
jgi:hypothetical protein